MSTNRVQKHATDFERKSEIRDNKKNPVVLH